MPFRHDTVDGHFVTGSDPNLVAYLYIIQRHLLLAAICVKDASGLGGHIEECPYRFAGALSRAQLHNLT